MGKINLWDEVKHRQQQMDRLLNMPLRVPKMIRIKCDDIEYGNVSSLCIDRLKDILPFV